MRLDAVVPDLSKANFCFKLIQTSAFAGAAFAVATAVGGGASADSSMNIGSEHV